MNNFCDYPEALKWIKQRSKNYKSLNDFYSSDEYKFAYPYILKMYKEKKSFFANKGMEELKKSGLKIGDKVFYDFVSYFYVTTYTGILIEKGGIPCVKLDDGQKTMSGKKSVRWHKGFIKLKDQ